MKRLLVLVLIAAACAPKKKEPVVVSLLGAQYFEPQRDAAVQAKLDSNLMVAKKNFYDNPSEENYIWYGRRTAYFLRVDEAIKIYSEGLEKYPDSYRLMRHRGHRYITQRKFELAIADLKKAEELMAGKPLEVEPDGAPNKLNIPLSTTQFNVYYHLALAQYLIRDFHSSLETWKKCLSVCENDDSRVAVYHWMFMTLGKQGNLAVGKEMLQTVGDSLTIIENDAYDKLLRIYQEKDSVKLDGDTPLTASTLGYGIGNWYFCKGDPARAKEIFHTVISGNEFAAFGFIAAEADLAYWSQWPN